MQSKLPLSICLNALYHEAKWIDNNEIVLYLSWSSYVFPTLTPLHNKSKSSLVLTSKTLHKTGALGCAKVRPAVPSLLFVISRCTTQSHAAIIGSFFFFFFCLCPRALNVLRIISQEICEAWLSLLEQNMTPILEALFSLLG